MKGLSAKLLIMALATTLAALPVYADRKHGDVENIGNRSVSGRVFGIFPNFVSLEKEVELGAQIASEFEQTAKLVEDPVVTEYVDRVGQNIVKHSDAKVPFHIKVVDSDEVNAFAFPGGYFYVNKGLILAADNEAELAGVMAHEISHVTARHATMRMSKAQYLQIAAIPALFVGGYLAQMGIQNALGLGINLELMGITRESERRRISWAFSICGIQGTTRTLLFPSLKNCRNRKRASPAVWPDGSAPIRRQTTVSSLR